VVEVLPKPKMRKNSKESFNKDEQTQQFEVQNWDLNGYDLENKVEKATKERRSWQG
jgi:hypothetical protein